MKFNINDFTYDRSKSIYRLKDSDRFFINAFGVIDRESAYYKNSDSVENRLDFREIYLSLTVANKLKKRKTINRDYFSYGFKHLVERYFNNHVKAKQHVYISNGSSIIGLLMAGFDIRFIPCIGSKDIYSPNVEFNVSTLSYNSLSRLSR